MANKPKNTMRPLTARELADFLDWVKRGRPREKVNLVRESDRVREQVRRDMLERKALGHFRRHVTQTRRPTH